MIKQGQYCYRIYSIYINQHNIVIVFDSIYDQINIIYMLSYLLNLGINRRHQWIVMRIYSIYINRITILHRRIYSYLPINRAKYCYPYLQSIHIEAHGTGTSLGDPYLGQWLYQSRHLNSCIKVFTQFISIGNSNIVIVFTQFIVNHRHNISYRHLLNCRYQSTQYCYRIYSIYIKLPATIHC